MIIVPSFVYPHFVYQVVLEMQDDGRLTTSDDPPVVFGCVEGDFIQKVIHTCKLLFQPMGH